MPRTRSIDALRARIDRIDEQILRLLRRRAELAIAVGHRKGGEGRSIYAPDREKRIFERLLEHNDGPLKPESIRAIFREIISGCLALEKPLRIAFLGPEGTYCQRAARDQFGAAARLVPLGSIDGTFDAVERRRADYGVVPVENSTEGVVAQSLDRFIDSPLTIKTEVLLRIDHCLLAREAKPKRLRRIIAHPQALAQCRGWLARNHPNMPLEEAASNAIAAATASRQGMVGAIAGRQAAERYGLQVVAASIQDHPDNFTRFLVIGRDGLGGPSGDDKTSVLFSVPHEPGALYRILAVFARNSINLDTIESRPMKGRPWQYVFFLDLTGHVRDPNMVKALTALEKRATFVKVLGSYPAWRWPAGAGRHGR